MRVFLINKNNTALKAYHLIFNQGSKGGYDVLTVSVTCRQQTDKGGVDHAKSRVPEVVAGAVESAVGSVAVTVW